MRFEKTHLDAIVVIHPELKEDHRGFFFRTFCSREFKRHGIEMETAQCNIAYSEKRGTVRGLHYQVVPATERKVVRCTRGSAYYVVVDLRQNSPTRGQQFGVELNDSNRRLLYVGPGFASGCQVLMDGTELAYQMSEFHGAAKEDGIRYDDPAIGIRWPIPVTIVSSKDKAWPPFQFESTETVCLQR